MNTHKYLFLGLFALSISSCNDFLDREPLDKITPESYFQTAEQLSTYALTQYILKHILDQAMISAFTEMITIRTFKCRVKGI